MGLFGGGDGGYKKASKYYKQLGQEASVTQDKIDPFSEHRSGIADLLNQYVTGQKSIETDPGYQFAMNEGMQQVNRAAAAKGYGQSGNVLAALKQRGSDIASQQYGSIIERLTNLAGATAQNAMAGGQAYGNMMETSLTGQAAAAVQKAQAKSAGISAGLGALGSLGGAVYGGMTGGLKGAKTGAELGGVLGSGIGAFF